LVLSIAALRRNQWAWHQMCRFHTWAQCLGTPFRIVHQTLSSERVARRNGFLQSCMKRCGKITAQSQVQLSQRSMGARLAKIVVSTCFRMRTSTKQLEDLPFAMRCVALAMALAWCRPQFTESNWTLMQHSPCSVPVKVSVACSKSEEQPWSSNTSGFQ